MCVEREGGRGGRGLVSVAIGFWGTLGLEVCVERVRLLGGMKVGGAVTLGLEYGVQGVREGDASGMEWLEDMRSAVIGPG